MEVSALQVTTAVIKAHPARPGIVIMGKWLSRRPLPHDHAGRWRFGFIPPCSTAATSMIAATLHNFRMVRRPDCPVLSARNL
jgi:hypothetical protein